MCLSYKETILNFLPSKKTTDLKNRKTNYLNHFLLKPNSKKDNQHI